MSMTKASESDSVLASSIVTSLSSFDWVLEIERTYIKRKTNSTFTSKGNPESTAQNKWTKYGWESNLKRLFTGVEAALADPIAAITLEGDGSILFAGFVSSKFGVLPGFISGGDILERVSSELECLRRRSSIYNENVIN
jgi:hypothetical protein